jgi:transposase InsO family protein
MSRKGNSMDNAVAESFFSTLKNELIHRSKLLTQKQMKVEIFEFIENWYNKKRIHSTLKYMTIEEFGKINNLKFVLLSNEGKV